MGENPFYQVLKKQEEIDTNKNFTAVKSVLENMAEGIQAYIGKFPSCKIVAKPQAWAMEYSVRLFAPNAEMVLVQVTVSPNSTTCEVLTFVGDRGKESCYISHLSSTLVRIVPSLREEIYNFKMHAVADFGEDGKGYESEEE